MRRTARLAALSILLALTLAGSATLADSVYMTSGKVYEGTVTRDGDKIIIQTARGEVTVKSSDVIAVVEAKTGDGDTPTPGTGGDPVEPTKPVEIQTETVEAYEPVDVSAATQPEPVIYALLQKLEATPASLESVRLREQIKDWRIIEHDRKRKVHGEWIKPEDFVRRRKAFDELTDEANKLLRKAHYASGSTRVERAERQQYMQNAAIKLRRASASWPDPLLRDFLMGQTYLITEEPARAVSLFEKCVERAPMVAAFHQGHALALLGAKRPADAIEAAMHVVRLRPDSSDAVELLQQVMEDAPGFVIQSDSYKAAQKMLSAYQLDTGKVAAYKSSSVRWLMPGRGWYVRGNALPTPKYDRLIIRQAVGVPVDKNTILVDPTAVSDALEVYVKLPDGTYIPAQPKRVSSYRSGKTPVDLAFVTVQSGHIFRPLPLAGADDLKTGAKVRSFSVGTFPLLGTEIRQQRGQVIVREGTPKPTVALLPGEGTSPVLADSGKIAGVLVGKLSLQPDKNEDRFVPATELADMVERGLRGSSRGRYSRVKRTVTTQPSEATLLRVIGIFEETFSEK